MSDSKQLFPDSNVNARSTMAERRIFYVTNVTNLLGILASGLVRPKGGWPKYAPDFQELTPGFIPLFVGGAPIYQLDLVVQHDSNDLPVIIEFSADSWLGDGMGGVDSAGRCQPVSLPAIPADVQVLLVRGTISLADAQRLYFGSKDDVTRFASYCFTLSNTRVDMLSHEDSFSHVANLTYTPPGTEELSGGMTDEACRVALRRVDAVGGILAALLRAASDDGAIIIRRLFPQWRTQSAKKDDSGKNLEPEVRTMLEKWIRDERRQSTDPMAMLLSATLDFLVNQPVGMGFSPEAALDHLGQMTAPIQEQHRDRLNERLRAIRATVLQDQDPQAFFKQGSPVLHGLLLFLLDPEYSDERRLPRGCSPTAQALLIADVMRGVLNGWSRVPVLMRGAPQSELAVGYAMAQLVNRMPGAIRLPDRAFEWEDDESELVSVLAEIIRILKEKGAVVGLRQIAGDKRVQSIEINLKAGLGKRGAKRKLERSIKTSGVKTKKSTLRIALNLPW